MNILRPVLVGLLLLVVGATSSAACSSSSSNAACNQNPFSCPAGQTCWVRSGPGDYQCLSSGSGQSGDLCQPTEGTATCKDGLACIEPVDSPGQPATCTPFCDSAHPCPSGQSCTQATFDGTNYSGVCYSPAPVDDGGPPDDSCPFLCDDGSSADTGQPPIDSGVDAPAESGADAPGE